MYPTVYYNKSKERKRELDLSLSLSFFFISFFFLLRFPPSSLRDSPLIKSFHPFHASFFFYRWYATNSVRLQRRENPCQQTSVDSTHTVRQKDFLVRYTDALSIDSCNIFSKEKKGGGNDGLFHDPSRWTTKNTASESGAKWRESFVLFFFLTSREEGL